MAFTTSTPVNPGKTLLPSTIALIIAVLLSPIHVSALGVSWSLIWLPFLVLALWSRSAPIFPTAIAFFIGGMWVDWVTLGALGQWSFVYLVTILVRFSPRASKESGIGRAYIRFGLCLLVGLPVYALTGWAVYASLPDWLTLCRGLLFVAILVPPVAALRDVVARRYGQDM